MNSNPTTAELNRRFYIVMISLFLGIPIFAMALAFAVTHWSEELGTIYSAAIATIQFFFGDMIINTALWTLLWLAIGAALLCIPLIYEYGGNHT